MTWLYKLSKEVEDSAGHHNTASSQYISHLWLGYIHIYIHISIYVYISIIYIYEPAKVVEDLAGPVSQEVVSAQNTPVL